MDELVEVPQAIGLREIIVTGLVGGDLGEVSEAAIASFGQQRADVFKVSAGASCPDGKYERHSRPVVPSGTQVQRNRKLGGFCFHRSIADY